MIGLFLSEAILFAAAGLIGFAVGWRLFAMVQASRRREEDQTIEQLRGALTEAQVRRARAS
jgi:hypothetical protein